MSVGWIPGHSGIVSYELADSVAKSALEEARRVFRGCVSLPACKRLAIKQVNSRWQERWNRSATGCETHAFIQHVGRNSLLPRHRCTAESYVRMLLDDTTLKDHMCRCGLADSRLCECGQSVEDVYHFLLKYPTHDANRSRLFSQIQEICSDGEKSYTVPMSVMLLLSPGQHDNFTKKQCAAILDATFEYIHLSRRHL